MLYRTSGWARSFGSANGPEAAEFQCQLLASTKHATEAAACYAFLLGEPLSADFATGRGGFLQLLSASLAIVLLR